MIRERVWEAVRAEDFPEGSDERWIFEHFGIAIMVKLYDLFRGQALYLTDRDFLEFKERYIRENLNGYSPREFARLLDLDESGVYKIIKEITGGKRRRRAMKEAPNTPTENMNENDA